MASGALAGCGGDGPLLASPRDTCERNCGLQESLGHVGLACVDHLDLKSGAEGIGVPLGEHEARVFEELDVLPGRMSPEEDGGVFGRNRGTV